MTREALVKLTLSRKNIPFVNVADYALARLFGKAAPSSMDVNPVYIPGETF